MRITSIPFIWKTEGTTLPNHSAGAGAMNDYKGYTATVEYDASANRLHGRVDNVSSVISFVAPSASELQREFELSVDEYLAFCSERGVEPEKPHPRPLP